MHRHSHRQLREDSPLGDPTSGSTPSVSSNAQHINSTFSPTRPLAPQCTFPPLEQPVLNETRRCNNLYSESDVVKVIGEYLGETLTTTPLQPDNFFADTHIGLGILACAWGLYANFGVKFAEEPRKLWLCIAMHFICILMWGFVELFVLAGVAITFLSSEGKRYGAAVQLQRQQGTVTVTLRACPRWPWGHGPIPKQSVTRDLPHYFYASGVLNTEALYEDIRSLYKTLIMDEFELEISRVTTSPSGAPQFSVFEGQSNRSKKFT